MTSNDKNTVKQIAATAIKEKELAQVGQEKRMRSRKWLSWTTWLLIAVASLVMVYTNHAGTLDINLVIKMFGIVTIIYILGNVFEKFVLIFATKLAEIIGKKFESFIDMQ